MDLFVSLFLLFSFVHLVTPIALPPPDGPFNVAVTDHKVTDPSRRDPYSTNHEPRSLMLSTFHPIAKDIPSTQTTTPYMPAAVAAYYDTQFSAYGIPNGTFASFNLTTVIPAAAAGNLTHESPDCHPIILFSPGLGDSRLVYSNTASALAAQGFTVITIDHPYDSPVVVFPDGSIITAAGTNITSDAEVEKALNVRSDDIVFVASQAHDFLPRSPSSCHCNGTAAPIYAAGHSLGGAASVDAVRRSKILKASANLDGALWGAETKNSTSLSKPVLLFGSERNATIPSWQSVWPRILGPKVELELEHSKHGTFTDFPFLIDVLGFRDALGEAVDGVLGTIDAGDALRAVVEVLAAWSGNASGRGAVEEVVSVAEGNGDLAVVRR